MGWLPMCYIMKKQKDNFRFLLEQFADLKIMRFQVPGFEEMDLRQKKLIYYLSEAALSGRDIIYDQFFKYNLLVRRTLEEIVKHYEGDRNTEDFKEFMIYTKRVWFSNGIHHHYSTEKFYPEITKAYFAELVENSPKADFPMNEGESLSYFIERIIKALFCPSCAPKRINQSEGVDLVLGSASNFYKDVSQKEVEEFYNAMMEPNDETPVSYGLNSKLVKDEEGVKELVYTSTGLYGEAISQIVYWLEKAVEVAENDAQKSYLKILIKYYHTGDLKLWDDFSIAWTKDQLSIVDFVNGFIENYADPMGMKATFESLVNFKDVEASHRSELLAENAQWFEDHSPVDERFKKKKVEGVSSKVITAATISGDCYPATPIGINLPNADWIRARHGSKSVTIENITYAYDQASRGNGFLEEFYLTQEEIDLEHKYGFMADNLHTDMHECLGHGSGQLLEKTDPNALKNYGSPMEEARADLFALYYMMDPKLIELRILPDEAAAKIQYLGYIRGGAMLQLTRIELGKTVEQAHMRCRKLIAEWCIEKGSKEKVIEKVVKEGKTYLVVNDYQKLRKLFGELLKEVQRIKSEGDYEAAKNMIETYAVQIDLVLHEEVKDRFKKLNIAPYSGFINPEFKPVYEKDEIIDVVIEYPDSFTEQNLKYSKKYSFLPTQN